MRARTWIVLGLVILWASPGGAAPRCSREARDACQAERYRCERDCPDLTACARRCREAQQECLDDACRGLAFPPANPK